MGIGIGMADDDGGGLPLFGIRISDEMDGDGTGGGYMCCCS